MERGSFHEETGVIVSILMGVYHPSPDIAALKRAVNSMLCQTFRDFELLICDDGSSCEVRTYLERLAGRDPRIQLVRPGNTIVLPMKLNRCLGQARGRYIARMDDDDYSYPARLERQLKYLQAHPEISFAGCNVSLIQEGRQIGERHFPELPTIRDFYMTQPYIHPVLLFRRECLEAVGGYSEEKSVLLCEDYDLLLRLYGKGFRGANLQEILFDYTIPPTAKGRRRMCHRWNEAVTRWRRFRELGVLPGAFPYVVKPLAVGMLPEKLLEKFHYRRIAR